MKSFASDNYAGVLPEVMEALQRANSEHARSYGADDITARTIKLFREVFGADVDVYFVFNGTGANVLSISSATMSYNAVLCADVSHIYCDESSAPETFTGCRFFPLPANDEGKLTPEVIQQRLMRKGDVHYAQTKLLSITQSTEYGTVYKPEEIKAIADLAHANDLYLHMDGSRFLNAAAGLGCELKDISTNVGVDILSLGGTKAGMMFGEAVVVFNKKLSEHIAYKQKQSMQLASKTRFIAAQFEAMLGNDNWRQHATHANKMAQQLNGVLLKYPQIKLTKPVHANAVFAELPVEWTTVLQEKYPFYIWKESSNEARLMCSWDTSSTDIEGFATELERLSQ
ncbi:threonine aldolase family protein [Polluticoccus soli]|uniref:threonine aldolase family protein n=1 Tax=Polluticoccus soli TaxID=3034150 RepID=UPI0023E1AB1D|nr:low specificity L-threonine aldolase [Flavipsychrobacter sp. JY13-12]